MTTLTADEAHTMTTYRMADGDLVSGEFGWVANTEYFEDTEEPVELIKEVWVLQVAEDLTIFPTHWVTDHAWIGIENHPDDDECSVCQESKSIHADIDE